jgi:predicted TIM-barrel fold metal-dependent hydrolase
MIMTSPVIDFHVHVLPDGPLAVLPARSRRRVRDWLRPYTRSLHRAQTALRHLPERARRPIDELSALAPLPSLIFESTSADLREAMELAGVDRAVVIAHPPFMPNEFVLELCQSDPRFIAAVNIPRGTQRPGARLKKFFEGGARILKIHPASDGDGVDSPRYRALLKAADDFGMPVILHTGCMHSHLLYRDPDQGRAERFTPWFGDFPGVRFILAHMNMHEPGVALDLAERFANVSVDTSWQPEEMIGEAVRRIGHERVLFGTDWPLVGQNIAIGMRRVRECQSMGMITELQARAILGGNAVRLLGAGESAGAPQ